jgi:predicted nucleotidyltransferase
MNLKELRKSKKLTQKKASEYVNIPLRTYKNYENEDRKIGTIKYDYIINKLNKYGYIDEEHGIQTLNEIKRISRSILNKFNVEYCYLFGSYAKDKANEKSDIDLLISTSTTGIEFYGLVEELRVSLKKKVEILTVEQLRSNQNLVNEILKDGIKIYG